MAILRILVIVAVLLAVCDLSLARKKVRSAGVLKPLSNRALKRGLVLEETFTLESRDIKVTTNPPTLAADNITMTEDDPRVCIDVLANDYDYEGNLDKTTLEIFQHPTHGWANVNGAGLVCYKPKSHFHGTDSFSYSVCDRTDNCEWALVRVKVNSVNDAPTVRDDEAVVEEDQYSVTIDVLINDDDVDGAYVNFNTLKVVQKPCNGIAVVTKDNKIIYTPNWSEDTRYFGEDTFIYQICDNEDPNLCSYGTVTVEVKDKCLACEKCRDLLPTFNEHAKRIQYTYQSSIVANL